MELILKGLQGVLELYAAQLPSWLVGAVLVVGSLRVVFKPAFALAYAIAAVTESKKDDEAVKKIEQSKVAKAVAFLLDYVASIKLPPKK